MAECFKYQVIVRMKVEGLRSPYQKLCGLYHLPRMLDKIRLHQAGRLPAEYHPNFGLTVGLDGHLCGFLEVEFAAVYDRVRQGGSDDEVVEWCFQRGLRPTKMQIRLWNEFSRKFGWNDAAGKFVERVKREDGLEHRPDVVTAFDLIDLREGRDHRHAKETLGGSEQNFRLIVESIPGFVCTTTATGEIEFVNRRILDYLGKTLEESKDWRRTLLHEDDCERVINSWSRSVATGEPYDIEHRVRRFDGVFRWFHVRGLPLREADGRIIRWYVLLTDIDERKRAETLLAGENRLLEMVTTGSPLTKMLSALCRLIEELSNGSLCGILLVDPTGNRVEHGAAPSLPQGYNAAIHGRPVNPSAGPCGMAACLKEQVIVNDVASDTRWDGSEWRTLALSHGLRACWSTPILSSNGTVLGTFAIYWPEPRSPTEQHQRIIEQTTHLASVVIERKRTEEELRRSEAYLAEAQRLSLTGSFGWNVSTGEIIWSRETYCILGYDRTVKPNLNLVLERIPLEDRALVQQIMDRATRDGTDLDFGHRLLMPDRAVKHVHVVARATKAESGAIEFVGAVMDVTEQKRAEILVAGEKKLLEMIARGSSLSSVLDALCRFGEEMSGDALVSLLLVSPDGKSLRHGAAPSLPKSYTEAIDGGLIGPRAGSCGTAAYRGERVIVSDIATDPLWDQYRYLAMEHGLRACWSTPIFSTTRNVMGTFALYSREPGSPSSEQLNLIEQITHLAAVAIERKRAEEALRRSESRFEGILAIAEDAIISIDSNQRILLFNQGAEKVFGYDKSEVIGKPLDVLLPQRFVHAHRGHIESFAKSPEVSRAMGQRRELFGIRKVGQEFPAEASISKLDLGGELIFTVILRDITERKRAAEALRASEHLARGQLDALTHTLDSVAEESDPDRLLEHVLRTIVEQTGAHGVSAWERNEDGGWLDLVAVIENGRFQTRKDAVHPAARISLLAQSHPVWSEVFRTREHAVLEDIDQECARSRVGSDPDAVWHRVMEDGSSEPALLLLKKHLQGLGVRAVLFVPMLIAGRVTGIIGVRFSQKRAFQKDEIELTQALAHQAMLAIQLMRLSEQSRQAAVAAERNRMARDIHDTLAQGFTGVIMQLEATKGAIAQNNLAEATDRVERAGDLARVGLGEARRSVMALRPRSLQGTSLCMALDDLLKRMTNGSGLQAEFHLEGDEPTMPAEWEESLLRIAQESLTNTVKHAKAKNFRATLTIAANAIQFHLVDDGAGFDLHAEHEGFGLVGMKERVDQIGGQFILRSLPGQGTEIQIILKNPIKSKPDCGGEHA
jgi:PAS domain S-box-containing protein